MLVGGRALDARPLRGGPAGPYSFEMAESDARPCLQWPGWGLAEVEAWTRRTAPPRRSVAEVPAVEGAVVTPI
jgi:hypothetical protein